MTRCYDTRVKRSVPTLILLLCSYLALAQDLARKPVEEVVAVIDRTPLLTSDIDLAEVLVLIDRPFSANDADYRSALLDARIQLEVQFRDLESSGVLYRLDLDVIGVRRNLLDNVGKFTSPGVPIRIGWSEAGSGKVVIRVEDEGSGIAAGERGKLFVRYERGKSAKQEGIPGTGLGLSLVAELCEGMGGTARYAPGETSASWAGLYGNQIFWLPILYPAVPGQTASGQLRCAHFWVNVWQKRWIRAGRLPRRHPGH